MMEEEDTVINMVRCSMRGDTCGVIHRIDRVSQNGKRPRAPTSDEDDKRLSKRMKVNEDEEEVSESCACRVEGWQCA